MPASSAMGGGVPSKINATRHKINTTFLAVLGKFSNVAFIKDVFRYSPRKYQTSKITDMTSNFLPFVNLVELNQAYSSGKSEIVYEMLAEPLHEELFNRQSFDFLDDLSWGQQLLLAYDYMHMQVMQGGFIQFIHNGYVSLLPSMIEQLYKLGASDMAMVLDDALKVYVLNRDLLERSTTVQEFAQLYGELKEFEGIDERYYQLNDATTQKLINYAVQNLNEFVSAA